MTVTPHAKNQTLFPAGQAISMSVAQAKIANATINKNSVKDQSPVTVFPQKPVADQDHCSAKPASAQPQAGFDYQRCFVRVKEKLRARVGQEAFNSWFNRVELDDATPSIVRLSVPTLFLRSWINEHYQDVLTDYWKAELEGLVRVELVVRSATRASLAHAAAPKKLAHDSQAATPSQKAPRPAGLGEGRSAFLSPSEQAERPRRKPVDGSAIDPRYTFDSFVEGPSNRVCVAAAKSVVEGNANANRFNPLFFYSSVGLGKTHLLQAVANEVTRRDPSKRVVYLTAEYFMHAFATAIQNKNALMLKQSLHDIDLLIIDDMQFLQGEKIQSEFCHLINALLDSARHVIAAADRPPSELESLDKRVRSRLHSGVALEIAAPDYDMRYNMLVERLADAQKEDQSLAIADEVLAHVARTVTSSFRELEGAFNQLVFRHSVEPGIGLDRIDDILSHLIRTDERKKVRIEDIQRVVSQHYDVARNELLSNRRTRKIVRPRQIAMYLAKQLTPRSLPEIGRRFGGRDHTTVLHAVRKVEAMKAEDPQLGKEIELLRRLIEE